MFPCGSNVTSVGRPKRYFSGGAAGACCRTAPATGSGRRPSTIITRPSGLNLITMFVPSSTVQMLSCAIDPDGVRELEAVQRPGRSRGRKLPFWSNSNSRVSPLRV